MEYRKLGNSGTLVSNLALGTMNFGTAETPEQDAFAQLDAFVEAGGNLVDTADVYNNGIAETTVGQWFASRPHEVTDHVVLATKGRTKTGDDVNEAGMSRRHLDRALTTSLRRLQVDTIDLYQIHAWDPLTPIEEMLSFLDSAIRAGKIRYLGWSPLASGFLTGKYQRGQRRSSDTRAGQDNPLYQYTSANYENSERTWNAVDAVGKVAATLGAAPANIALSWVINRPGVTSAIVGARTQRQLLDNLAAADLHLDEDSTALLDSASDLDPAPYPYGPFGTAQRTRTANAPEALGRLISAHAATTRH
jgi:aryl-alcohol dehydrogenase-like predicted oxidoreductase